MVVRQIKVRHPQSIPESPVSERQVQRQLSWAAGAEQFQHRDPLYHITESFQQTFDRMGRRHAAELDGGTERAARSGETVPGERDPTDMTVDYQYRDPAQQDLLQKFSEIAFQRGTLAGGVVRGTGQMMLFSCLKKTIGQSQPTRMQQRRLFEGGSQRCSVPGHTPDKVVFNRGFTDSAVGLVVDTLRDARRMVETMTDLALGKSSMGAGGGADTLRRMYPFLDIRAERALLERYQAQLETASDPKTRQVLQSAIVRTRALLDKKAQMKAELIGKLRFLTERAAETLDTFEQPGFPAELHRALEESTAVVEPPPEPPEDEADPHGPET